MAQTAKSAEKIKETQEKSSGAAEKKNKEAIAPEEQQQHTSPVDDGISIFCWIIAKIPIKKYLGGKEEFTNSYSKAVLPLISWFDKVFKKRLLFLNIWKRNNLELKKCYEQNSKIFNFCFGKIKKKNFFHNLAEKEKKRPKEMEEKRLEEIKPKIMKRNAKEVKKNL